MVIRTSNHRRSPVPPKLPLPMPSFSPQASPSEIRMVLAPCTPSPIATVAMLCWREWTRFFRQRNRVIGALGQPILFWLLFGTGMHAAFRGGDQDFMTYYLPGTLALILLFTAIFTTISIIEDRREGFLQNVLVAPVPRWTIAAGKILGGGAIAWVQALIFLMLAIAVGSVQFNIGLLAVPVLMAISALTLTALGVFFAWPMDSTQGFHAIMNLVLMPLWLLSGAFFPVPQPNASSPVGQWIIHWIMRANPLSYTIAGMRRILGNTHQPAVDLWVPSLAECWLVSLGFLAFTFSAAWWAVLRPAKSDAK
jgi:ABC-2 type transport system permease protein